MALKVYGYDVGSPPNQSLASGYLTFTQGNPRTRIVRSIAAAQGIEIELSESIPRQNINRDFLISRFPRSRGKIPVLEGHAVTLTEYLAKLKPSNLLGDGSVEQEAEVLSWVNWANQELLMIMSRWFLPLIPGLARPAPYNKAAVETGKEATIAILDIHEKMMQRKEYLVGDHITLADIFVAIYLSRGMERVLDAEWRARHPESMRHFNMVANWGPVKQAVPHFTFIEKESPNVDPYSQ
ncbi:hypothetical protein QQS21_004372 [Conoideocrella luteorostrata]|uniref:GST C-terminal domain-containing protein n=1 Tax=Conoideocrella luteorostrata TaxID=1105319 RepID=A0AAJ0CUC2_9HYPO|nr:hypothetical protein QQS21_004372 [Conoideocrella luteorostrata]